MPYCLAFERVNTVFEEYDHVRIKATGVEGIIVDIATIKGKEVYTIEGDEKVPCGNGNGEDWPLIQCSESDIEATG